MARKQTQKRRFESYNVCTAQVCDHCKKVQPLEVSKTIKWTGKHSLNGLVEKIVNPVWKIEQDRIVAETTAEKAVAEQAAKAERILVEQLALGEPLPAVSKKTVHILLQAAKASLSDQVDFFYVPCRMMDLFLLFRF